MGEGLGMCDLQKTTQMQIFPKTMSMIMETSPQNFILLFKNCKISFNNYSPKAKFDFVM